MNGKHDSTPPRASAPLPLPRWTAWAGWVSLLGSAVLAARLVWEQTVWTWERGPQWVGFSLAHGAGLALFLFPVLLLGWLLLVTVATAYDGLRARRFDLRRTLTALGAIAVLTVLYLPYGFWQRAFIDRLPGDRLGEFFVFAAASGDLGTVQALRGRGIEIDARGTDGATALQGAAAEGRADVIRYLLEHGADPRLRDAAGRTALDEARAANRENAVRILLRRLGVTPGADSG